MTRDSIVTQNTYTRMFIVTLLITASNWKQDKCLFSRRVDQSHVFIIVQWSATTWQPNHRLLIYIIGVDITTIWFITWMHTFQFCFCVIKMKLFSANWYWKIVASTKYVCMHINKLKLYDILYKHEQILCVNLK